MTSGRPSKLASRVASSRRRQAAARRGPPPERPFFGEAAEANGDDAASALIGISKYYEQVAYVELVHGAAALGVPRVITALALHLYSGPRRIRVGKAWSGVAWPRRSVLPGCTWAAMLVRLITIGPA